MIYLDNAATTRVSKSVCDAALWTMYDDYGNPSSLHKAGMNAAKRVQEAREQIGKCIGAKSVRIIQLSSV